MHILCLHIVRIAREPFVNVYSFRTQQTFQQMRAFVRFAISIDLAVFNAEFEDRIVVGFK